jgi:mycothiol synthase
MGEEDIAAVATLLRAAEAADGHAPLGEHQWIDLVQGGRAGFAGFVARVPGSAKLLGYAQLSRGHDSWAVEYVVHPTARSPEDGVAQDLLRAALDELAREGGGHVHLWVPKPGPGADEIAHAVGLRRGRTLFQMRRPLPLEPELAQARRAEMRPFRVGVDEAAWLGVNNRAFHGHPEQGAWEPETLHEREHLAWFDADDFLIHETDGRLDAFCWTKVHDDEPSLGEIYVIGVDPDAQGHGLGRGVLLAGLDHLAALKLETAMLYVDADDEAAVHLYLSVGFSVNHRDQAYVGDVAPGTP